MLIALLPAMFIALETTGGMDPRNMFPELGPPLWIHLWFLWVLLWLYPIVIGCRYVLLQLVPSIPAGCDTGFSWLMGFPLHALVLSLPIVAILPPWRWWWGIPTPHDLARDPHASAIYGYVFVLGWLVHRQLELLQDLRRYWRVNLGIGTRATIFSLYLTDWKNAILASRSCHCHLPPSA